MEKDEGEEEEEEEEEAEEEATPEVSKQETEFILNTCIHSAFKRSCI